MNKIVYALFFLVVMSSFASKAQNAVIVGSEEYQKLKQEDKLSLIPQDQILQPSVEKILNPDDFAPQDVTGGGGNFNLNCNSLVPIDQTFQAPVFSCGSPPLYQNDDCVAGPITLPFDFCFYGTSFNSLYINNNGNISFNQSYNTFTPLVFPNNQYTMICPFWADVDTRGTGVVYYQTSPTHLVVRWNNVGYFNSQTDKVNDFQLIITDGNDPIIPGGNNVAFSYGDMQWTTGSASGGINGFGGTAAIVGANQGNGVNSMMIGTFDHAGNDYDGPFGSADGVSWLDNKTFLFDVCINTSNLAPVPDGSLAFCDTIQLCVGDTLPLNFSLLSPEQGQVTTVTIDTSNASGFVLNNNTAGNTAYVDADFYATVENMGINTIVVTATDNGTPSATNVLTFNIFVSEIVQPSLIGDFTYCAPGSVTVTLDSAFTYADYTWSTGDAAPDSVLTPLLEGNYSVTCFNEYGCSRTLDFDVVELANLIMSPTVIDVTCNGSDNGVASIQPNTPAPLNIVWLNSSGDTLQSGFHGNGADQINGLPPGSYYISSYDTTGCFSHLDSVTIAEPQPYSSAYQSSPETCEEANGVAVITNVDGNTPPYNYFWSPEGGTAAMADSLAAGTYTVTIIDANGCEKIDTVVVEGIVSPTANFVSNNAAVLLGDNVMFSDSSLANGDTIISWYWNFADGTIDSIANPVHAFQDTGHYPVMLVVTNTQGCTDTVVIDVIVITEIKVPNIFNTASSVHENSVFYIKYLDLYPGSKLYIYNRWGKRVYKSDDYKNDWDGENHSEGTYFYILEVSDGTKRKGNITVIKK